MIQYKTRGYTHREGKRGREGERLIERRGRESEREQKRKRERERDVTIPYHVYIDKTKPRSASAPRMKGPAARTKTIVGY